MLNSTNHFLVQEPQKEGGKLKKKTPRNLGFRTSHGLEAGHHPDDFPRNRHGKGGGLQGGKSQTESGGVL